MRSLAQSLEEGTAGQDAVWSATVHAMGVRPSRLPPSMAPIPLSDAIAVAPRLTDEHAAGRSRRVLRLVAKVAEVPAPVHRKICDASPGDDLDALTKPIRHGLARQNIKVSRASIGSLVEHLASEEDPCVDPETKMTLGGPDDEPVLLTSHVVRRPLEELVPLLDPRYWDKCGDLFALTRRVRDEGSFRYPVYEPDPVPPGHDWAGLLHERAVIPGQQADNILRINFRVDLAKGAGGETIVSGPDRSAHDDISEYLEGDAPVQVDFSLFHGLGYEVGGIDLPGLEVQNSGKMVAWRVGSDKTRICSRKQISYARLTTWGGTGTWDYGEALTYAAPATLCLWTEELHLVVGCCNRV